MPGRKTPSSSKRPISNLLSQLAEFSLGDEPPAREADNTAKNNQWSSRSSSRAAPSNRSQRQEAPPANSRIPALKGYGGLEEDDDDSWMNDSQGQDALNALLSKARTRESMVCI